MRTEIANLDTRLSAQIGDVRTEQRTGIAGIRTEIASLETRLVRWMVGTVIATAGVTFAILRFSRRVRRRTWVDWPVRYQRKWSM